MAEMILPGVYIDVRAEGLIAAGQVTVGNIGMVGTARRGPVGRAVLLSTYAEAVEMFGAYDEWDPAGTPLTLVRALELAYANGATTVYAVRVEASGAKAKAATFALVGGATVATLQAPTPGSWGNDVEVNVWEADANAVVTEVIIEPAAMKLAHNPAKSVTPRIRVFRKLAGQTQVPAVSFGAAAPAESGKVTVADDGTLQFFPGSPAPLAPSEVPAGGDVVTITYEVDAGSARKVSLRLGGLTESYIVADGKHLASLLGGPLDPAGSPLARADKAAATTGLPDKFKGLADWRKMGPGTNAGSDGAATSDNDYKDGLELLTNEEVHIVVAAGQGTAIADRLLAHVQSASSDKVHRDRVAVLGSNLDATPAQIAQHNVASDRLVFVGPGIRTSDAASKKSDKSVVLPGAYAAAAVAGMMSARDPHVSLTNKVVAVAGVAGGAGHGTKPTPAELELMVQNRVLALEERQGVRVVKAITTDDGAFKQVTTRRIVDYAKFGVRSASQPFIGLLNNDRVRKALQGSINGFLAGMVDDEMLVSYDLAVTATRDEEIRGIARVTMTVKPTFSIDYIKVTMFLG
jgi:Phage tail sheath C-terminal domain